MEKVLIIKMSALGDVFMELPHVKSILTHHPDDAERLIEQIAWMQIRNHRAYLSYRETPEKA